MARIARIAVQPANPRDFYRVALHRLSAAEAIFGRLRINLEAQYIGGYAVECALKALILERTPEDRRAEVLVQLTRGKEPHRKEFLLGKLRDLSVEPTPEVARRMRHFRWTTDLRYELGRTKTGETRAVLRTAKQVCDWVEGQLQ